MGLVMIIAEAAQHAGHQPNIELFFVLVGCAFVIIIIATMGTALLSAFAAMVRK